MSDSYQPIYDAVRSRISGGDIGQAVADVARNAFDISQTVSSVAQYVTACADEISIEQRRPCAVFRPSVQMDGDQWCSLYGADLQAGVAGFGDTPAEAMVAFDKAWLTPIRKFPPSV
jgi:hypothetical protein